MKLVALARRPKLEVTLVLGKAWSESARQAAIEARKANAGKGHDSPVKNEKKVEKVEGTSKVPLGPTHPLVGKNTMPYKKPPGTAPVKVLSVKDDIAYLSDGSDMHVSRVKEVPGAQESAPSVPKSSVFSDKNQHWDSVKVENDTPGSTTVKEAIEVPRTSRMKGIPGADEVVLRQEHRAVDYNSQLLQEKYGPQRGEEMYQTSIDSGGFRKNPSAGPFLMHNQIQKEKLAMMRELGKTGHPDDHHYQGLYQKFWGHQAEKMMKLGWKGKI